MSWRRAVFAGLVAAAFVPAAPAASSPQDARLDGTFAMRGTITYAHNVYGEHRGQHVQRNWVFTSTCTRGACSQVRLARQRSERGFTDVVRLRRVKPGTYSGTGQFWVALRCAGRVISHGGLAHEKIVVRIRAAQNVGTTPFATAVTATYSNPRRVNLTRCPGGIGRDGASYAGIRASPLPGPPTARFTFAVDPASSSAAFTDQSRPDGGGAAVLGWNWDFGDPSSPGDVSTQRNPTHRFSGPGTYLVTLKVTDSFGRSATVSEQVTV